MYANNLQRIGLYRIFEVLTAMTVGVRVSWNVLPLFLYISTSLHGAETTRRRNQKRKYINTLKSCLKFCGYFVYYQVNCPRNLSFAHIVFSEFLMILITKIIFIRNINYFNFVTKNNTFSVEIYLLNIECMRFGLHCFISRISSYTFATLHIFE